MGNSFELIKKSIEIGASVSYTFEINSNKLELEKLHDQLSELVNSICNQQESRQIILALDECLNNAYEHGNLELSHSDKSKFLDNESFENELRNREGLHSHRKITVCFIYQDKMLTFSIKDEGKGFNWRKQQTSLDPDMLHGRGLKIIASAFDVVRFNEVGNECVLSRKIL